MNRPRQSLRPAAIVFAAFVVGMGSVVPQTAEAGQESGLPLGPLVARPSVSVGLIFDSNVYRTQTSPERDLGLEVSPGFGLTYPGENFRWEFSTYYRFFTYFNAGLPEGQTHDDLRQFTMFGVSTSFDVNRLGKAGLWFAPSVLNGPITRGVTDSLEQEFAVTVPLELRLRPTRAFQIDVGAKWLFGHNYVTLGSPAVTSPTTIADRHEISGGFGIDWRFFPRSHLVFDGEVGHIFWRNTNSALAVDSDRKEPTFWRVSLGLRGDITRKIGYRAMIGYGNSYFPEASGTPNLTGIQGLMGDVEIAFRPVITQRLALGFRRTFGSQYYADRVEDTVAYFQYLGLFAERLEAAADVTYDFRNLVGGTDRSEHQLSAGAGLTGIVTEWFRVGGGYRFTGTVASSTGSGLYLDHRINVGVTFGYR